MLSIYIPTNSATLSEDKKFTLLYRFLPLSNQSEYFFCSIDRTSLWSLCTLKSNRHNKGGVRLFFIYNRGNGLLQRNPSWISHAGDILFLYYHLQGNLAQICLNFTMHIYVAIPKPAANYFLLSKTPITRQDSSLWNVLAEKTINHLHFLTIQTSPYKCLPNT